jgi:microcompartment protein CcmK/EutM
MKIAWIYGSLALTKKGKIILGKMILILQKLNNKFIE